MENQSGEKRGRGSAGAGTLRIPKRRSPPAHNSGGRGPPPAGGGYPRDFRGRGGYGGFDNAKAKTDDAKSGPSTKEKKATVKYRGK